MTTGGRVKGGTEGLASRAKRREAAAFAEIFDVFFERLRRYAYYQVGDLHLAEDLAAEAIRAGIEGIDRFDARAGSLQAWLYGITRNLVARHFREAGLRREVSIDDVPALSSGEAPYDQLLRELTYEELYKAISLLSEDQREVIILRYIEGYRSKTVASIMGKKPGAVRGIQHRALDALRRTLVASDASLSSSPGRVVGQHGGGPLGTPGNRTSYNGEASRVD